MILFLAYALTAPARQTSTAPHAAAGKPPSQAPTPTIKVRVNQVLVPVVVTDQGGHSVVGLKAGDFEVFEDGVEQKLSVFQTENERAPEDGHVVSLDPSASSAQPLPSLPAGGKTPLRRTYLVCLDTFNSSFENFVYVRNALHKLFKQEQDGDSLYAILTMGRTLAMPQNLTRDPAAVLAAIGSKNLTRAIQQSESANLKSQEEELKRMLTEYCGGCPCFGESATAGGRGAMKGGSVCGGELQRIERWAGSMAEERSYLTRAFLQNLNVVVERMGQMPGKRIIVFVSDGFNTHPGRNLFDIISAYTRDPSEAMNGSINDAEPQIQDILRAASAHNVVFYTLDSRGLSVADGGVFEASDSAEMTDMYKVLPELQQQRQITALEDQGPLAELAQATGGVFFHNNNDLFRGLRQAFADGREYYLLAYASSNQAMDGKFREIKVSVKGKNLIVRAKHGYWAASN
ncbi:MAG TPA: VWA domain-containing protein [Terriglobia bacterium]|nr:VWA domain-containing protein [Terriglobia bacterium]